MERRVVDILKREGFHQTVNYGFTSEEFQKRFLGETALGRDLGLPYSEAAVKILNPLTAEGNVMRCSLLPELMKNLKSNYHYGTWTGRLFEVGQGFGKAGADGYVQHHLLSAVIWGKPLDWQIKEPPRNIFRLKTAIDNLLTQFVSNAYRWQNLGDKAPSFLHPAQSAGLFYEGKWVGFVGTLHPQWCEEWKIRADVAVAEFSLHSLLQGQPRRPKLKSLSKQPIVERDLAFVMARGLEVGEVMQEMRKLAGAMLQSVEVFDLYEGENVGADRKSVAFRLTYQDLQATLSDNQILDLQNRIIDGLGRKFSISVR